MWQPISDLVRCYYSISYPTAPLAFRRRMAPKVWGEVVEDQTDWAQETLL